MCVCECVYGINTHTHTRRGAVAARVGNPKDMGEYVGYKTLFLALTVVMQLSLHLLARMRMYIYTYACKYKRAHMHTCRAVYTCIICVLVILLCLRIFPC